MTCPLYALLIGISEYDRRSGISALQGCTNDAQAMQDYLEARVASSQQLHVQRSWQS
ncbi:MAG: caspase family protein [Phormidesmis sp.]